MAQTTTEAAETERRKAEREIRRKYERSEHYAKWRALQTETLSILGEADQQRNRQVFDFVQRAITAAVVLAATLYVCRGFSNPPVNWFAYGVWTLSAIGLLILSYRLALATWDEANRFGALLATEFAISIQLDYRPRRRRHLTNIIALALFAAIVSLGSLIGAQAINQTNPVGQNCAGLAVN